MVTTLGIGALIVYHDTNNDPTIQKINTFKEAQIDFKGAIPLNLCTLGWTILELLLQAFSKLSIPTFFCT
jgi:hypothetical protein